MAAKMATRPYYYLQEMSELENMHPDVYLKFVNGRHVVTRSNKFCAGLSSDLVIEQTLMRSHKTSVGLTHGSGMNKEQRSLWTMSMPVTAMYNIAMQDFNNLTYTTSDQRKDRTKTLGLPGDADIDIVKTVVDSSHQHSTTLIREDTDLLILLLHYADTDPDIKDLYFRSEKTCATNVQDINRLKAIRHQTYAHSFSSFMHSLVVIQRQGYLVSERRRLSRN